MHEVSTSLGFVVSGRSLFLGIFAFFASILKISFFPFYFPIARSRWLGSVLFGRGVEDAIFFLTEFLQILIVASSFGARSSGQRWRGLGRCGFWKAL